MYRSVLLCYDGSKEGRNALAEGAEVARAMNAQAHLLAVLRPAAGPPEGVTEHALRGEEEAARRILDEGVAWLRERGLDALGHLSFGDPLVEIPACARALNADLIVVGHRPRTALERWWSDAEDASLLESAPCSILAACGSGAPRR
jgi:nucleotide-binding universal stress UspA family protein